MGKKEGQCPDPAPAMPRLYPCHAPAMPELYETPSHAASWPRENMNSDEVTQVTACHSDHAAVDLPASPLDPFLALGSASASQATAETSSGPTDETTNGDEDSNDANDNSNNRASKRKRGDVWEHYEEPPACNGVKVAKCRYCEKRYTVSNSTTGNLWRHIRKVHPTCIPQEPADKQAIAYTHSAFREMLVEWVVCNDQPFSEVETHRLRNLIRLLHPGAKVPSADTLRNDIDERFNREKARVRAMLQDAPGRLSFAVDAWTSPNTKDFLGITVHWIDASWQLRNTLLAIPPLGESHTGEALCTAFEATCRDFGVMSKLLAITTDNASNNDTFLGHLETACGQQGIQFSRESAHVRCVAHIINLAAQRFLGALDSATPGSEDGSGEQRVVDDETAGFILRLRGLVVKVRDSPQRRKKFARQCTHSGISPKELILDVPTRWSSTYAMIERALELRDPLDAMAALEQGLTEYKLTPRAWQLLESVLPLFKAFKTATNYLCAAGYPTLTTAVPVYNYLIDALEDYRDNRENVDVIRAATRAALEKIQTYYSKTVADVYAVTTILDPRFKLQYYKENDWEQRWIDEAVESFRNAYAYYRDPSAPRTGERLPVDHDNTDLMETVFRRRPTENPDELDEYLSAPAANTGTDVLQWWKTNATTYPCLATMARDYLAIPATGAPVERVFSGGTDLVQPKRGSLSENSVHVCMCLKSWLELPP